MKTLSDYLVNNKIKYYLWYISFNQISVMLLYLPKYIYRKKRSCNPGKKWKSGSWIRIGFHDKRSDQRSKYTYYMQNIW